MHTIQIRLPDQEYYKLVEEAAKCQKDVDEFLEELAKREVGIEGEDTTHEYSSFREFLIDRLDVEPGTTMGANVVGVVERMRKGLSWPEAVQDRAEQYASGNPKIQDANTYTDTVRDCCTRRLGMSTQEFKEKARSLIEEYGDEVPEQEVRSGTAATGKRYIVHISDSSERLATFGQDVSKDQSEVMADAVNYLIEEHDLIEEIEPLPYVVKTKALINDQPTYPDGTEQMRHFKELTGGYYLDTHYKKEDKKLRLEDLVKECGLGVTFEGEW